MVIADSPAAETELDQVQDLTALGVLAYVKLRDELPTGPRPRVPLHGDVKRSFSIDITCNVGIQPFLLIDRTRGIVTAHVATLTVASDKWRVARDTRCFQHLAEFKDSNGHSLSHDVLNPA